VSTELVTETIAESATTERQLSESEWRRMVRQANPLSESETERLKRARFATDPTCDHCRKGVETLEDADYVTTTIGHRSTASHSLFIHNACLLGTIEKMAIVASRLGRRR
jgi:hypothetical protein